ncbi:MAG: PPC domain-containing DNA-binding protein [Variovorax sp.]
MIWIMAALETSPRTFPVRLLPGDDLRRALEAVVVAQGMAAAFVVAGIGSLRPAEIRLAGAQEVMTIDSDTELLTLSGSVASTGSHLHMSVADQQGRVVGGHACYGCTVRTTAEVLLVLLPEWHFSRKLDRATGWAELAIKRNTGA